MVPIEQITAEMSRAELEREKQLRDDVKVRMNDEMAIIHALLEPKWQAQIEASRGPAHLAQGVVPVIRLGD